jgi:CxxC-x17-CxxC domain-containing protein
VEEKIARWSGMMEMEDYEKLAKSPKKTIVYPSSEKTAAPLPVRQNNFSPVPQRTVSVQRNTLETPKPLVQKKDDIIKESVSQVYEIKEPILPKETKEEKKPVGTDRPIYEAVCDTCEEKIQVPFKPDPTRPTFCKECLKDFQRARARAQQSEPRKEEKKTYAPVRAEEEKKEFRPVAFVPKERPLSLDQMSHMAPKKFQPQRKKADVDLREVRDLINKTKNDGA